MTIQQLAGRLVELCRKGDFETAQKELFSENALSIEPYSTPEFDKETHGLQAIIEKGKKFEEMTEAIHSIEISDPLFVAGTVVTRLSMDITMKQKGRMKMTELCLYKVKDGKIVSEEFFI